MVSAGTVSCARRGAIGARAPEALPHRIRTNPSLAAAEPTEHAECLRAERTQAAGTRTNPSPQDPELLALVAANARRRTITRGRGRPSTARSIVSMAALRGARSWVTICQTRGSFTRG